MGLLENGHEEMLWGDESVQEQDCDDGYSTNVLKLTELYTFNGCVVWYVKYSSTEL